MRETRDYSFLMTAQPTSANHNFLRKPIQVLLLLINKCIYAILLKSTDYQSINYVHL